MTLKEFNSLSPEKAKLELFRCCGCKSWVDQLMQHFPFASMEVLKLNSDDAWLACTPEDWLEAFSNHPKIGDREISGKHGATKDWAQSEQSGVKNAEQELLAELVEANKLYERRNGFIFIVCATGKSAREMLTILKERLNNGREKELQIAAAEQNKITHLRIDKLLS